MALEQIFINDYAAQGLKGVSIHLTGVDIFPSAAALIDDAPGRSVDAARAVFGGPAMLMTVSTLPDTSDEADSLG